jgi:superfamily II RNA helicase
MGERDGRYLSLPLVERLLSADGLLQPFDQLTTLTDVAEGTIVRVITRLDETCREVRDAARVIGDAALMKKMEEAQMKIKRDSKCLTFSASTCFTDRDRTVVFAASLYF